MTNIVDSDTRYSRFFGSPVHLPVEITLGDGEHPVIRPDAVEHFEIVLNFICQKLRHGDDAVAFLCLWGGNQVLPVQPLIGFTDGDSAFFKIEISGGEGKQFPLPDTAPVEHFKSVERLRFIHHRLRKFQILLLGPEHHLPVFLLAHAARLFTGILPEVVVTHRMIENGAELRKDLSRVISAERSQIINVNFLQKQGATVFYGNPLLFSNSYRIKFQ